MEPVEQQGPLKVDGKGKERSVTLEVSHVLKCPDDLKALKPKIVLNVKPRPVGFSDQDGDGVWSLEIDRKGDRLFVAKYEFITYGRNHEEIEKALENVAGQQAIEHATAMVRKTTPRAELVPIQSKNIHLPDWTIEHPLQGNYFFCATLGYTPASPIRKFAQTKFNRVNSTGRTAVTSQLVNLAISSHPASLEL